MTPTPAARRGRAGQPTMRTVTDGPLPGTFQATGNPVPKLEILTADGASQAIANVIMPVLKEHADALLSLKAAVDALQKGDEEKVKERLKALGYID